MVLSFHDQQHINRLFVQEQSVNRLFGALIDSVSPALKRWNSTGRQNVWIRNAAVESLVDYRLAEFQSEFEKLVKSGSLNAWNLSAEKNDKLVSDYIKDLAIKQIAKQGMFNRNLEALTAFQKRVENGISLSDRVASTAQGAKQQLEHYLRSGIGAGRSAGSISQDIRQLLQEPDKRFRRIRNENGVLIESQPMKDYHPGQGVYRSSYKNAVRIAASETNMAYRMADHERWKQLDFILGFEVKRSRNHESCAVCDALVGKYPKDFVFPGWHPFCICVATPILMNQKDFIINELIDGSRKYREKLIAKGIDPQKKAINYIKDIPAGAKQFMQDNPKLVDKSYFGKQNKQFYF
jgi:hypothetical protein